MSIFIILIGILSFIFVSSVPFNYQVHETLEQKRPDLCKCQNVKSTKGRIYDGEKVNLDDLTFTGSLYYRHLIKPENYSDIEKKYDIFDFVHLPIGTVSLLNEECLGYKKFFRIDFDEEFKEGKDYKLEFRVAIGNHDLQISYRYNKYNFLVVCSILHPLHKYNELEGLYRYDVALLKLGKKVVLGSQTNIYPACFGHFNFEDIKDFLLLIPGFGHFRIKYFDPINNITYKTTTEATTITSPRINLKYINITSKGSETLSLSRSKYNSSLDYLCPRVKDIFCANDPDLKTGACAGVLVAGEDAVNVPKMQCGPGIVDMIQTVFDPVIDFVKTYTGNNLCIEN